MKKIVILIAIVLISIPTQAQWGKKIRGNGDTTTIIRNAGD